MDFELPRDDDARRLAVRAWLADHPSPTGRELAEAGYVVPHWPRPWGIDADPVHQLLVDEELDRAGIARPDNPIGIGWAGPTILHAGSEEQKRRWLPGLLAADTYWCQLFSEPEAGSDLANLRTRAVRDGGEWVINGSKLWSSYADHSDFGILLARTDPAAPKHRGISYFVLPMDRPGIDIRPVIEMTGGRHFNECFFTDVRIPADHLVGEEHDGWRLAKVTLANERVSLSTGGALWGLGPTSGDFLDLVRAAGGVADPLLRRRVAQVHVEATILRLLGYRVLTAMVHGETPGPEASVKKLLADEHGQRLMELAKDLAGAGGMLTDAGPLGTEVAEWHWGYLFSRALTIGGGTGEVQRNIIGERILGLPRG
ncbi:MAG: acyl-CoA dehydrogenase family protein [Acidimicrobiales bacterium]|nr:acyl-CoA dehydrogenase family protein [Acidimicrobiales bacterium]